MGTNENLDAAFQVLMAPLPVAEAVNNGPLGQRCTRAGIRPLVGHDESIRLSTGRGA